MIYELVNDCIESETEREIEKTRLKELTRYLHEFADFFQQNPISVEQISSDFMRRYVQFRGKGRGPNPVRPIIIGTSSPGTISVMRATINSLLILRPKTLERFAGRQMKRSEARGLF